ncbi:ORC2-domain-containing protein [Terfezia boudieri ATCC MYA-4762]|uniref:Origin recognition complex subunit 2 n=1 Tax=Terfezia boudieri ATCC MYA-4762 TaxID=1051890 RepID=A0A3N4MBE3_9PEZI|nr:ORC2-domain-containing protein [Terfezia boudieri ATCC MYA-4762]
MAPELNITWVPNLRPSYLLLVLFYSLYLIPKQLRTCDIQQIKEIIYHVLVFTSYWRTKNNEDDGDPWNTGVVRNADKSARRKGARIMLQKAMNGDLSDADDDEGEDVLASKIYSQLGLEEELDDEEDVEDVEDVEDGLLDEEEDGNSQGGKNPRKKRTTKKKIQEKYEPPPLEGFESYFEQHRRGTKTSNSTLAGLPQLDLGDYYRLLREYPLPHEGERAMLMDVHRENFGQWAFELSQGFNVMLYGYGSKRQLLMGFAAKIYTPKNHIVVVNGYVPAVTTRDILNNIFATILGVEHRRKLGSNPNDMLDKLIELLDGEEDDEDNDEDNDEGASTRFPSDARITLIIHSLDGESIRAERHQSLLSRLASHPRVSLVASTDHIKAPLLWDSAKVSQFNFLWHDATTFQPYSSAEASVEELLYMGGSGRAGGTKGVKYVLASLPQNAKELYRILVSHQLQAMEEDGAGGAGEVGEMYGVEYKVLYQMGVEEFICSNDMAFRTLLKEFQDHQMVTSKKDVQGTEVLWAPFRKEELESVLEDIMVA